MDKPKRNDIQRSTQAARALLERAFGEQLEGTYDILLDGTIAAQAGGHLNDHQKVIREKLVATMAHKRSTGMSGSTAVQAYLREAAFTTLNRFVALKMLEARGLVLECVSKGEDSSGFRNEFAALAPGLVAVEDKGYRLYIETLFDEIGQEVKVLFDRRDVASLLWPDRQTLLELLGILNAPELAGVWTEDETIGWVYQYFNGDEERTRMRAESQAPRNSRELAVRNQFFTPRYVVQFLTDNTLGRTWYEMMQGETKLADLDYLVRRPNEVFLADGESAPENELEDSEFSQEELLQQTVYVPFRTKKDPRDLRILDPACGSGHFLLYAFDLLVSIYEEAWSDTEATAFTGTGTQLRADYGSIENLRCATPGLILRHNLHGVDIDPRAAQIAALALWMRAQRAYNQFDIDRAVRPSITKTNIVVAEPMPGDAVLVDEFAASLKPAVLGDLFRKMVEEMKLAGELGSLLKIEESIAKAVRAAANAHRREGLFAEKIETRDFWDTADEKIIAALTNFAESAGGSAGIRRQLFAGDAAQGVAFIELMRKRFDVVLMNPPFGLPSIGAKSKIGMDYPNAWTDIYNTFVCRGGDLSDGPPALGAIVPDRVLFTKKSASTRLLLLERLRLNLVVDIGPDVMDRAAVHAVMLVTCSGLPANAAQSLVCDPNCRDERESTIHRWCSTLQPTVDFSKFRRIPGAPFAIHIETEILNMWGSNSCLEPDIATVATGGKTFDDFRFLRCWWEVPRQELGEGWMPVDIGGDYQPGYAPPKMVQNWATDGREMRAAAIQSRGTDAQVIQSIKHWFRPAIAYPYTSSIGFSPRLLHGGTIISTDAVAIVPHQPSDRFWLLGTLLSTSTDSLLSTYGLGRKTENSSVKSLPVLVPTQKEELSEATEVFVNLVSELQAPDETSRYFTGNLRVQRKTIEAELRQQAIRIDLLATAVFGTRFLSGDQQPRLVDRFPSWLPKYTRPSYDDLVSFSLGVYFGRWAIDLSADETSRFYNDSNFASSDPSRDATASALLSDDLGSDNDMVGVDAILASIPAALRRAFSSDPATDESVRKYVRSSGFGSHIKRYQVGRRRAPIYWQFATSSASYSVWCYYHCLTRDTFFRVANDFVTPKVDHAERKLNSLRQEAGADPSSKQRNAIHAQETFVAELRAFGTEAKRIAPLWNPNLNDGVIINFAPLWRLVPQHKPWQKECKKVWDKLVKGDYDWAHLAMHLWPERVVPKCKDDRSLAIAHGLEEEFWYEDDGKWLKRQVSPDRLDAMIAERSSTAVKSALKDLLDAPTPTGQTRRKRRART